MATLKAGKANPKAPKAPKAAPKRHIPGNQGPQSIDRGKYRGELISLTVRVDRRTRELLEKIGHGVASAGIRILAREYGVQAASEAVKAIKVADTKK